MLNAVPVIILEELKRRLIIIMFSVFFSFTIIFLFNLSFIEQCFIFNYLLYYKLNCFISSIVFYDQVINSSYLIKYYYYPEQEYNFNINYIYNYFYLFEFLFLMFFIIPVIAYHFILFLKPALYLYEFHLFRFFIFGLVILITDIFITFYLGSFTFNLTSLNFQLDSNSSYYMNLDLISILYYYFSIFIGSFCLSLIYFGSYFYYNKLFVSNFSLTSIVFTNKLRFSHFILISFLFYYLPFAVILVILLTSLVINETLLYVSVYKRVSLIITKLTN